MKFHAIAAQLEFLAWRDAQLAAISLQLTGKRNPYGKLGVIEAGAMADILIYDTNPLEDITIIEDYDNTLDFIMKDGFVHKDTLGES